MAKVNSVSRGRTNIRIGRSESALVFSPTGVHNALSEESRNFINAMLTEGEEQAFKDITPEKFWTVVLPAVTYVKMAQYVKEVQQSNSPETDSVDVGESVSVEVETDGDTNVEEEEEQNIPIDAFDG